MKDITSKYRPKTWKDVLGQAKTVDALKRLVEAQDRHALLFVGDSGIGKTTLARIVAKKLGADLRQDVHEINAAERSGIDDMRAMVSQMASHGLGPSGVRVAIIDECHALSSQAWQPLLKATEDAGAHAYWIFCTTVEGKVPDTMETRCVKFRLDPVPVADIRGLVGKVNDEEKFGRPADVLDVVAEKSRGSPRRALVNLLACAQAADKAGALDVLHEVSEGGEDVRELCRALLDHDWKRTANALAPLRAKAGESTRIQVCNYMLSVVLNSKGIGAQAEKALGILSCFVQPFPTQSATSSLVVASARACK